METGQKYFEYWCLNRILADLELIELNGKRLSSFERRKKATLEDRMRVLRYQVLAEQTGGKGNEPGVSVF